MVSEASDIEGQQYSVMRVLMGEAEQGLGTPAEVLQPGLSGRLSQHD